MSHWGHDFRGDYRTLGQIRSWLPHVCCANLITFLPLSPAHFSLSPKGSLAGTDSNCHPSSSQRHLIFSTPQQPPWNLHKLWQVDTGRGKWRLNFMVERQTVSVKHVLNTFRPNLYLEVHTKSDSVLGDLKPIMQASRDEKDRSVLHDRLRYSYSVFSRPMHVFRFLFLVVWKRWAETWKWVI